MIIQKAKYIFLTAACFMLLFTFNAGAQTDSIQITSHAKKKATTQADRSPGKAMLFAIFPGGGQIYNKKYWKAGVLYAGLGVCTYAAIWNQEQYNIYSDAFDMRQAGEDDEFKDIYSDEQLIQIQNFYSKNRELSILIGVSLYAISFLDASVDAHLYAFDVSDDLSFKLEPAFFNMNNNHSMVYSGLRFKINF